MGDDAPHKSPSSSRPSLAPSEREIAGSSISPTPESRDLAPPVPGFVLPVNEARFGPLSTLRATFHAIPRIEKGAIFRQVDELGVQSLGFLCLVLGFVGSIVVYQAGLQALRIVPDTTGIGPMYIELLVRDLAASLTGLMLATRVGAGIAAEIGSMKVTDQLDALRLCRTDPVVFMVAPRVVACLLLTPIVTILAGTIALVTGTLTGLLAFGITPETFLDARHVTPVALLTGLAKSLAFGVAVPVVSAHAGLYTSGGSQGVGDATTRAVVGSSLAVIILGFFIGAVVQVLFG